jgi:hypothetical protein
MSKEALLWNTQPPPRCTPATGEPQWTLLKNGKRLRCELHFHGESWGWEAQFFEDGDFYGRRFDLKAEALQWAELEREERVRDGWRVFFHR